MMPTGAVSLVAGSLASMTDPTPLTPRDEAILALEESWPKHTGRKEEAIRSRFAMPAARYYQLVQGLASNPAAVAAHPQLTARIQRRTRERVAQRASRHF